MSGQLNLYLAVRKNLQYVSEDGKNYFMVPDPSNLFVRPRGLHLLEKHVLIGNNPIPGAFFDFGVYFYNNAKEILKQNKLPCFYIPKTESHKEARLWNEIFTYSESYLNIPHGSIKATFLIETLPAAFEMDEILYETREHSAGLNCGRWDYIFSYIKKLRNHKEFVLPDREKVSMDKGFLLNYSRLLIQTCHRRGAHAMGGMSAYIPVKNDESENSTAMSKVADDKTREVLLGHDGTWVAHPGLVKIAMQVFDKHMNSPNQINKKEEFVPIREDELLKPIEGSITETGLRKNIDVGIKYIESWLKGKGAVPIYNLMEDAATSEICRSQIWQWINVGAETEQGVKIEKTFSKENNRIRKRQRCQHQAHSIKL
ncbi:malate synthase A [mine drainage metagenome]|uniref:malate synthase n=1 Tax=mine drainage metagenome TaxID=410659 RepID=T1ARF5_9ZZZZ